MTCTSVCGMAPRQRNEQAQTVFITLQQLATTVRGLWESSWSLDGSTRIQIQRHGSTVDPLVFIAPGLLSVRTRDFSTKTTPFDGAPVRQKRHSIRHSTRRGKCRLCNDGFYWPRGDSPTGRPRSPLNSCHKNSTNKTGGRP